MTVTVDDDFFTVAVLPIHPERGYPHSVYVPLLDEVFKITFGVNTYDGVLQMTLHNTTSDTTWWIGRVLPGGRWRVRNPTTGIFRIGFFVKNANPSQPEIFVWVNQET